MMAERAEPAVHRRASEAVPPDAPVALGSLVLADRRERLATGEDWMARGPGGRRFRVWRIVGLDEERRSACADDLRGMTRACHPNLVPVIAAGEHETDLWIVSGMDASRSLRRLLRVAVLTPAQAAQVAVEVLEGMQALHLAGLFHGRLDETAVRVGEAGQVRLGEWGLGLDDLDAEARRAADRAAARRLMARLGAAVRRADAPLAARLAGALAACADDGQEAALAGVREAAGALLDEATCERAAQELGALVRHLEREPADLAAPPPARRRRVATPIARPYAPPSRRGPRLAAGLSVLLLIAAAGAVATIVRPSLSRQSVAVPPVVRAVTGTATPSPGRPASGLRAVPVVAPPAAGPITGIELQPLRGSCRPGAVCPVQVTVRLQPQPSAQEVRWSFRVFDRCTGATRVVPGATATALAGWAYVFASSSPSLTANHPQALVAVTEAPAAAASPAVLANGGNTC